MNLPEVKTISAIQGAGTYESPHGLLYSFDYEFEDNTSIRANHKTQQSPFNVGDEVNVIVKGTKEDFSWGQVQRKMDGFEFGDRSSTSTSNSVTRFEDRDAKRQSLIMNQWAIKTAIDCEMNLASPDKFELRNAIAVAKLLKEYALDLENVDCTLQAEEPIENPF
ncbi:hypothetical protein [Acinetobacter sp.]|uniref:hypothetical protein n=1 Tax=Acinetobacter sp. TaxID=472 RepID=UPI000C0BAFBF|nr:hypothetical protein [Acinetobacter sp.]MAK31598.1 hypothetical protein [Acinetobacter sp.]|tara:strand:+ start:667 stop:1161 length:495 start_codon:yes stop_codon:yes gene_type:complete